MTYEEFLKKVDPNDEIYCYGSGRSILEKRWVIGGRYGGSCWGTGEHTYSSREAEPEPEFEELDKIIEIFCPNITFLQYKNLFKEVVKSDTNGYDDYYGNYTKYGVKKLDLRDLYDYFVNKGWISGY